MLYLVGIFRTSSLGGSMSNYPERTALRKRGVGVYKGQGQCELSAQMTQQGACSEKCIKLSVLFFAKYAPKAIK